MPPAGVPQQQPDQQQHYEQSAYQQPTYQQSAHQQAFQSQPPHSTQQFQSQSWPSGGGYTAMAPMQQHRNRHTGLIAGAAVLALAAGLLGGGVGGYVGYQLGGDKGAVTSLEQPRPARSASTAPQGSVQQVAEKVLPSVVQLQVVTGRGAGEGSGIILSSDGYILTNNHVVDGGGQGRGQVTAQFQDNRSAPVRIVGTDPKSDLAVVKADVTGLTPADLGRSDDLPVGAAVVAIGSPFGLSGTVTSGIISAKDRPVRAGGESGSQESVLDALQTDAAINPGNSGGPLVDMDGNVVGINSAIYSPGSGQEQAGSVGLGFAIPVDQARRIATELKDTGSATQTTLGVTIGNAQQAGAQVRDVVPGGPAEQAGIRSGDVITKMDDRSIMDADALVAAVRSHAPGDRVRITITGSGGDRTADATLTGQKG